MFAYVHSAIIQGLEVRMVRVETDVSDGLPTLQLIGFLSSEVKEAGGRVRSALRNSGIYLPAKRIIINLAPADFPKRGALLDLPIAISITAAMQQIPMQNLAETLVLGELGLDGKICPVSGVLLMVKKARKEGMSCVLLPKENAKEASLVPEMTVIGVSDMEEVLEFLREGVYTPQDEDTPISIQANYRVDFADVKGQYTARRAALIAAAGYHNLLFLGPPGSGKTMLASRIPTIMPPMSYEECMELTGIYSAAGLLSPETPFMTTRPYRAPHHTVTSPALIGGGSIPKPGEVTLSDHGILFLDELTEFKRPVLELLRQPLEDHSVRVSRIQGNFCFPADFLLVAAANPCPCGYYPDLQRCHCKEGEIRRYLGRISGPLMDRIDLHVRVEGVTYEMITQERFSNAEEHPEGPYTSEEMQREVLKAWKLQQERYKGQEYHYNGRIPSNKLKKWCVLTDEGKRLLKNAYERLRLSARSYHRAIRVARTIADLSGEEIITAEHVAEALSYRNGIEAGE